MRDVLEFFLILNQNIYCGTQKNCFNELVLLASKTYKLKLMGYKIFKILSTKILCINLDIDSAFER